MSTITIKRGDISLVYFPHSDLITIKLRPVLVVQADRLDTGVSQVLVAMISSNLARSSHPARVTIRIGDPEAAGSGLKLDSVVMGDNLATIDLRLIQARIGKLADMTAVDNALRVALGL